MLKGKKIKSNIALLICIIMVALLALAGCGSSDKSASDGTMGEVDPTYGIEGGTPVDGLMIESLGTDEQNRLGESKLKDSALPTPILYADNVKLIYTAYLSLQTTDFEAAQNQLTELVNANGGYFEASYIDRGSYYAEESHLLGNYTVRVPADKYEAFLLAVGENCHVVSLNKTTTDVGMDYFDTEARLNTLKAKQARLTQLLNEAKTMSDIIELENSLSNTQYDIDMYTSTINRYDSLIGFSTVQISIEEVARLGTGVDESEGFFASLGRSLVNGFNNFVDGIQGLIMWIAYNIVAIAIAILAVIFARKWYVKRAKEKGPMFSSFSLKRRFRKTEKSKEIDSNKDIEK